MGNKPQGSPEFVKGEVSIKVSKAIAWLEQHQKGGWVYLDLKESTGGNLYLELDTWKMPKKEAEPVEREQPPVPLNGVEYPEEDLGEIPF